MKLLFQIRELRHENLAAFVGVCVESGSACIVSAYCSRGSLARVLADRDLHLDDMFVASLVADLLRGLTYLHDSPLISHGNLTSSNCLVDSRWVLQITDYGLHNLKCKYTSHALKTYMPNKVFILTFFVRFIVYYIMRFMVINHIKNG